MYFCMNAIDFPQPPADTPTWVVATVFIVLSIATLVRWSTPMLGLWLRHQLQLRQLKFTKDLTGTYGLPALRDLPPVLDAIRGDDLSDDPPGGAVGPADETDGAG